jgi:dihydropteroate synthase
MNPFPARRTTIFRAGPHSWELGRVTRILGIVNCTPDSFSDGGEYLTADAIRRRMWQVAEEGADFVDIGGESTRPGAAPVDADQEWNRIEPAFTVARRGGYPIPVSVDTMKVEVARRALDQGAVIVNDVSGLRAAGAMAELVAHHGAGLILMHMQGEPRTMQDDPRYDDLLHEIHGFLARATETARAAGIETDRILVDPGIGFGKTLEHNLALIREVSRFGDLGAGVMIGSSRKRFLGTILGGGRRVVDVVARREASLASFVAAVLAGAHVIRAHDVRGAFDAVRVADAVRG